MSRRAGNSATWIFATVILALAGYTYYDFQHNKKESLGENEIKVVSLTDDEFAEILIKSNTQTVQLKKEGGGWRLLQPIVDETDDNGVSSLITSISNAKVQRIVEDDKKVPIHWEKYGLSPGVLIEIGTDKGKKIQFSVSDTNAFDGSFYLRKDDQLYLGDRVWAHIADKQVNLLRSHRIWRGSGAVTEVQYHYDYGGKTESATFSKSEDGSWKATPAFDLPINPDKMASWFDELKDLKATDFAAASLLGADREKFLLVKPSAKIEIKLKKDDKLTSLQFVIGQDKDNDVFVVSSTRDDVFKVSKFSLRNIRVPIERLLDTSSALKPSIEETRELKISHGGRTSRFIRGDKDWKMEPPPMDGSFRSETLADFFQKLGGLDPIADIPPAGLSFESEKEQIAILGKEKPLLQMSWSNEKDMLRWLKISGFKENFKVSAERLNALLNMKFTDATKTKEKK